MTPFAPLSPPTVPDPALLGAPPAPPALPTVAATSPSPLTRLEAFISQHSPAVAAHSRADPATGVATDVTYKNVHALATEENVDKCKALVTQIIEENTKGKLVPKFPKTRLKHQHIIAYVLANPFATGTDLCSFFGITRMTLSRIWRSDTFQALVAHHRICLETSVGQDLKEMLAQTHEMAMEVVQESLATNRNGDYALKVADKIGGQMGLGGAKAPAINIQNNNIITAGDLAAAREARAARQLTPPDAHAALPSAT